MHEHILATEWLTTRDVTLMPGLGKANSRQDIALSPFIYSAPMDTVTGYDLTEAMLEQEEMPVVSRFIDPGERQSCINDFYDNENFWVAVGFNDQIDTNFEYNIALDVAHGDMVAAHKYTEELRKDSKVIYIMSGSICTPDAAVRAIKHGCTHLRVGVGPGAACTTRLKTGVGVPNLSAVYRIHKHLVDMGLRNKVDIIADGGIKEPGDVAKYLVAGADAVMLGSVLSKTSESAGWISDVHGLWSEGLGRSKSYRGQASAEFQHAMFGKANKCPEGAASKPFRWDGLTLEDVLEEYRGGVMSSASYLGALDLLDMRDHINQMVKITSAGWLEGTPHGTL